MSVLQNEFKVPDSAHPESWHTMRIGSSYFYDDVWDLRFLMRNQRSSVHAMGKLNFQLLKKRPLLIEAFKRYFYIRLGQVKPFTVSNEYYGLATKLVQFLEDHHLDSLLEMNTTHFIAFNIWLKKKYSTEVTLPNNLGRIANTLLQIIKTGQSFHFPHIIKEPIRLEVSVWDWWSVTRYKGDKQAFFIKDRSIPLSLWKDIVQKAWAEPSILKHIKSGKSQGLYRMNHARYAVLIQAYTGLRISEILYLHRGCTEADKENRYWLHTTIEKTQSEPTAHRILIPKEIFTLIEELERVSKPLSDEAKQKYYLFYMLSKVRKKEDKDEPSKRLDPRELESGKYNSTILRPFLKRNNISQTFVNSDNQTIKVTSHCFRHTYANIAIAQKGINASVLQTHFKHLSLEMTMHYIHLNKQDLKKSYLKGMMQSEYSIYTQGKEGEKFKRMINEAKGIKDLNEITEDLGKLFGFNALPFGLCLYDFKRGKCPHLGATSCHMLGCGDFITDTHFLPNFIQEKEVLQTQLEHCKAHGHTIEAKKAYYHLQKVETIIHTLQEGKDGKG